MRITEILDADRIICNAEIISKKSALEELSRLIAGSSSSLSYTEIFDCLNARERLGSTGLGNGVAIPHARYQGITVPTAAVLQLKTAIEYDAVDQKPVDLLFGLVVPEDATEEHLQILAGIAKICSDEFLLNKLRFSNSPEELFKSLQDK